MARQNDWEANLASSIVGIAAIGVLLAVVVVATLLWLTICELYKIYSTRGTGSSQSSRYLWGALACFLGVLLFAGLLTATTHDGSAGFAVASLGFFTYVLACEYIDWLARRTEKPPEELALADVASWQPATELADQ